MAYYEKLKINTKEVFMKKLNSYWYCTEDIRKVNGERRYVSDPNGYLYSKAKYSTKIKAEDLPEWYIYGRYYKRFGYLSAKGVADLYYIPNKHFNHFLRDDDLFIAYKDKIDRSITHAYDLLWVNGIGNASGPYILYMLKAIRKYSNYDISPIIEQIKEKKEWLKENHPDDYIYECKDFDIDKFFEEE